MEWINDKLLNFASVLDEEAKLQAERTASLPFVHPHVALMPDAHVGLGATVGSVIPTEGAIVPAAVGVDIGCGMVAVRTQFSRGLITRGGRSDLRRDIEHQVPLSAGHFNTAVTPTAQARIAQLEGRAAAAGFDPGVYAANWRLQLGSLGSGNHFIEVSSDENGQVWLFLHSGSRGVGNRLAEHHIGVAEKYCDARGIVLPGPGLAYLREGTPEFARYVAELGWAQEFALANREEMMDRLVAAVGRWTGLPVHELERINCHHNYTVRERHYGRELWVTRKGAIDAATGVAGMIPGSMGTPSYIVEGKGFAPSLRSAPHGAGRRYSRRAARRMFNQAQLRQAMEGIEYRDSAAFVDEIPAAYKDIRSVMDDSRQLVGIRHVLRQAVNVKGD
ncbi:RtcB family protein [Paenarthrobacter sp. DKR-5]|uniref:RtcB family protein n=1 Tax=Paenarthrobacter sp. DKR-5 TaxID=2835535 RepID=UPI001BDBD59C|nr:RtcB family protein [Paenarthrobacter sp. DKR-5]MBT1001795.1 RtcB family protein [Paenarthrobacter sp. DKR-5]